MFAAVEIYQDFNHKYPPQVDQYGLRFVSEDLKACEDYVKAHKSEFLEMHGHSFPAVVSFEPKDFPKTMEYHKASPELHICYWKEAERMAANIVVKGF